MSPDVCVIGGGPAGLAAAIACRLIGRSVVVLESGYPPLDKPCGEGLLPDAVQALAELGVHIPPGAGHPLSGIRFLRGTSVAEAHFRGRHALGLRRTVLHDLLAARARDLGVELRWNTPGAHLQDRTVFLGATRFEPALVIGADGQNSLVRQQAGLNAGVLQQSRFGFRRHYACVPWSSYVEVYWSRNCQFYITPVSDSSIGVALLTNDPHQRIADCLSQFPVLAARLSHCPPLTAERGAMVSMRRLKRVQRYGLALIGDASGSVDAIAGEGLGLALRQSLALARAVQAGNLQLYQRSHLRLARAATRSARLLLILSRYQRLQTPAISGLARYPSLFNRLLAWHAGV